MFWFKSCPNKTNRGLEKYLENKDIIEAILIDF